MTKKQLRRVRKIRPVLSVFAILLTVLTLLFLLLETPLVRNGFQSNLSDDIKTALSSHAAVHDSISGALEALHESTQSDNSYSASTNHSYSNHTEVMSRSVQFLLASVPFDSYVYETTGGTVLYNHISFLPDYWLPTESGASPDNSDSSDTASYRVIYVDPESGDVTTTFHKDKTPYVEVVSTVSCPEGYTIILTTYHDVSSSYAAAEDTIHIARIIMMILLILSLIGTLVLSYVLASTGKKVKRR